MGLWLALELREAITSYSCIKEKYRSEEEKVGVVIPYPSSMSRLTEELRVKV